MKLRDYQETAVNQALAVLESMGLVYLVMQTRTGKTITSLSVASRRDARRVLFLTKKKVVPGVLADHAASGLNLDLTVMSVDSAHKAAGPFDLIIVDEAHCIGAFPVASKRAKQLRAITGQAEVILLSATPTPESYSQIYYQLWITARSPFAEYATFQAWAKRFVNIKQRIINGYRVNDYSDARIDDIRPYIDPITVTCTQAEAGFKHTEITEERRPVEMSPAIIQLVRLLLKQRYYRFADGSEIICDTPAKLASKIAQVASGTVIAERLVEDEDGRRVERVNHILDRAKAAEVLGITSTQKIAVFYKYDNERRMLLSVLPNATENPVEFQTSTDATFVCQYQSGREGIRLDTADAIVFFNPDHAYLSYEQTRNRIQDLSREKQPRLIWLCGQTGVEQKIIARVTNKTKYTSAHFMRDWKSLLREV